MLTLASRTPQRGRDVRFVPNSDFRTAIFNDPVDLGPAPELPRALADQ